MLPPKGLLMGNNYQRTTVIYNSLEGIKDEKF